jgi:hypothetical protein
MPAWLGDGTAAAAARILAALRSGEAARIATELERAAEICRTPVRDPCAAERSEVLEAIVRELRERGPADGLEAHTCLLTHLAGL